MRHERRRHPRLEVPLEVEVQLVLGKDEFSATMQDLSGGGAGLLTTAEIPVGTDIERLRFDLPQGDGAEPRTIEVAARVARCLQQTGLGGEAEFLIGLQFVDITRELYDVIQKFVFQRLRSSQKKRMPIERAIAIRFDRFDDFVDEVSVNLSTGGMFIRTRDPRPPGAVFNFQFQLGEDFSLIEGRAEVVWRRRHSEGPDKVAGMGVKFLNLDVPSQRLIDRLIAQRSAAQTEVAPQAVEDATEPAEAADPTAVEPEPSQAVPPEAATGAVERAKPSPPGLRQAEASIVGLGQVNALREMVEQLKEELGRTRGENERQLQELRASLEDRQAAASSELEERLRDAEAAHKESERQRVELAGELDGVKGDLDRARGEAVALQRQLDDRTSEEEVERLAAGHAALQATNTRLLGDLDRVTGEADEMRRQLGDRTAEKEIERLAAERAEMQVSHAALQGAHDGLQADLGRAREAAGDLEAQLDSRLSEEEAEELRRQLADRERAEADLQDELDELRRTHEATTTELTTEHSEALERTASEALEEADTRLRELQAEHEERHQQDAEAARQDLATAQAEGDRMRDDLAGAEQYYQRLESEIQQVRDEARQGSLHAEEREAALRAEAENAALAAAGGMPVVVDRPRRGRRAFTGVALIAIGALLGTLAVALFEPLGSLAARLRPGGEATVRAAAGPGPDRPASSPPAATQPPVESSPQPSTTDPEITAATPQLEPEPAPVAAPEPAPKPGPDPSTAEQAVRDWAAAWSAQRVDDYLASYAASFRPADGQSRDSWAANRRQGILRPASIEVAVEAARTVELADDRVSVSFDQAYSSDTSSDRVRKTLVFVWQDGAWKITEERVIE